MMQQEFLKLVENGRDDDNPCADDYRVSARMLLEWYNFGCPDEKRNQYAADILPEAKCQKDFDFLALIEWRPSEQEITELISEVCGLLYRKPMYEWVPYLVRGVSGHPSVISNFQGYVSDNWRTKPEICAVMLNSLWPSSVSSKFLSLVEKIGNETSNPSLEMECQSFLKAVT